MVRELCAAAALAALASCATPSGTASAGGPAIASSLPDFELTTVDGDTLRLSNHLGRDVVLLSFWQTWCEPCKAELPHLDRLYKAKRDQGFVVIAVSMDEPSTAMQVAPYVHEKGFEFPVVMDSNGRAANLYNTHKNAPYTVLIARDGTIASETTGFEVAEVEALERKIDALLAATPR